MGKNCKRAWVTEKEELKKASEVKEKVFNDEAGAEIDGKHRLKQTVELTSSRALGGSLGHE